MAGNYRALYAVWEVYGELQDEEEADAPPRPPEQKKGNDIVDEFASLLENI